MSAHTYSRIDFASRRTNIDRGLLHLFGLMPLDYKYHAVENSWATGNNTMSADLIWAKDSQLTEFDAAEH